MDSVAHGGLDSDDVTPLLGESEGHRRVQRHDRLKGEETKGE